MPTRRVALTAGVLGICAMAPERVRGATIEAEGTAYAGDSPGAFACGPTMRATYPGGAARVRVTEKDGRFFDTGLTAEFAGSLERQHYEIVKCPEDGCDAKDGPMPDSWMAGARTRGGYRWEHFGVEGGVSVYNYYESPDDRGPSLRLFPEFEVSGGVKDVVRGVVGIGSSTLTSIQRPGFYLGADVALGRGEVQMRVGGYRSGPADDAGARADIVGYVPLVPRLDLRLSVAGSHTDRFGGEGGAGLRASF